MLVGSLRRMTLRDLRVQAMSSMDLALPSQRSTIRRYVCPSLAWPGSSTITLEAKTYPEQKSSPEMGKWQVGSWVKKLGVLIGVRWVGGRVLRRYMLFLFRARRGKYREHGKEEAGQAVKAYFFCNQEFLEKITENRGETNKKQAGGRVTTPTTPGNQTESWRGVFGPVAMPCMSTDSMMVVP